MRSSARFLSPSDAANQLGVSIKALRLYEQRGLVAPHRTANGWRAYGPDEMTRAAEIVTLRKLGLSLAQIAQVLEGHAEGLAAALASHQATIEDRIQQLIKAVERIRNLRADLTRGEVPPTEELTRLLAPAVEYSVAFDLPWPWDGERFELNDIRSLNYIIGPLGSGKTRLALRLAETLPNAAFLGLERLVDDGAVARAGLDADPGLRARVDESLSWLADDGATISDALSALMVGLESEGPAILVIDMVEQGLDQGTQEALIACLRRRSGPRRRPLFLMTRSSAILDLGSVGSDEAVIFCPANHGRPMRVGPYPGAPGYEAVATCLASPDARARLATANDATDVAPRLPLWRRHAANVLG